MAKDKIQLSIAEEVEEEQMFGPFTHKQVARHFPFFPTSPLGSVVNADRKMRPIINFSSPKRDNSIPSVYSFVNKANFKTTWDDFNIVADFFRKNQGPFQLGLFDWEKAYRQIPTRMDQWPFLMVQDLEKILYLDTRITFGGVAGCDFADEQKFIGFIWNGVDLTVRLTTKKLDERRSQIGEFLIPKKEFRFNEAEVLAGRLNHVSYLLPQLRAYIRGVYR
ncbi:uncharacterized protein PGTG_11881 [Puccinia graminis f. sp. tritici CRL 75-36-700-3]|uniref:Reverse transcriptase domain-containing protein n=1 Tax=Puccinia graminis f. sp. tritici (strain CRL 75-36-700-3 / race SCCL) TaxID=418459 RepID=E3KMK0_PUCGT|nr:uncharacterized protein PGTG_11881 [Puccinia graminis f. sp. tritici CRL 75-36-700-3]EFP85525.1 hypothetical protein PGTG_11881 [Puccinia graminis f. sp. tritici CRL 75-36-700-3]